MIRLLLILIFGLITINCFYSESLHKNDNLLSCEQRNQIIKDIQWRCLIESLIYVESKGNDSIVGSHQDVGCLQETPIFISEANRIIGSNVYNLDDRYNRQKSIEIFEIIQKHHNPDKSIKKAIKLHNPKALKTYKDSVMCKYHKLLKQYHL